MSKPKNIAILGSTGSIGRQALEVISAYPEKYCVDTLVANNSVDLLIKQAKEYQPNIVIIANESKYKQIQDALSNEPIKVFAGNKDVEQVVANSNIDIVLTAMVGFSGLLPTINAIKNQKVIALANKETLVVAGDLIQKLLQENKASIRPVDSEHSAIFQCLSGEVGNEVEKIYLTASGGPFRNLDRSEFKNITLDQALKHPNWSMGNKITIDSATMMNKGLEAIEAKWLFNLRPEQIDILVHPQSIVHSMIQFADGSIKAQMGLPDMKLPIQYAFSYPERHFSNFERLDFTNYANLDFYKPDFKKFRALRLAYDVMEEGGNMPCVMNAANEIGVAAFLNREIRFDQISVVVEEVINKSKKMVAQSFDDYLICDRDSRIKSREIIQEITK